MVTICMLHHNKITRAEIFKNMACKKSVYFRSYNNDIIL